MDMPSESAASEVLLDHGLFTLAALGADRSATDIKAALDVKQALLASAAQGRVNADQAATAASGLPKEDRALLRAELEHLDEDVSQQDVEDAWDDEFARRLQSIKDGTAVLYEHDEVMRELEEIVKR